MKDFARLNHQLAKENKKLKKNNQNPEAKVNAYKMKCIGLLFVCGGVVYV